jgi:hypothetical protein
MLSFVLLNGSALTLAVDYVTLETFVRNVYLDPSVSN